MGGISSSSFWPMFLLILTCSYGIGLLYQALLHKIRGLKYHKEHRTSRALLFSTGEGDFRVDQVHGNFNHKSKGETSWHTIAFDDIHSIYIFQTQDNASIMEFFLSDFELWDFAGNYRDVTNIFSIRLWLKNGEEIPLMTLKQYEQRELWLGRITHAITLNILAKLGLYHAVEDVAAEKMHMLINKFRPLGLELQERSGHI